MTSGHPGRRRLSAAVLLSVLLAAGAGVGVTLIPAGDAPAVEADLRGRTSPEESTGLSPAQPGSAPALMRKQPYLVFPGANTEMDLHWQLTMPGSCTVEWGLDTTYALGRARTGACGSDYRHAYTITGLTPGMLYCYRVTVGSERYTGSFRAAPPDEATSVKFFAYGDTRTYPAKHDLVAQAVVRAYRADPDFQMMIISVGDLVSDGNSEAAWDSEFFTGAHPHIREMMANLPYESCLGNHDGTGLLFKKYFPYPFAAGRYWSFDYGPVHFAVVDQYTAYGAGSAQLDWLRDDLGSTAKRWKIVCLHEPGWSAGSHPNNTTVQSAIQPLLTEFGVVILFAGHNHYYARAVVGGVHHVTTGGGGAPLYNPDPARPSVVAASRAYHYCTVDVDGRLLHFEAVDTGGSVIDSFTVVHPDSGWGDDDEAPCGFELGAASPNPFMHDTQVSFTIPAAAEVRLAVFDVVGRRVRMLVEGAAEPGTWSTVWDGLADAGRRVSPGTYFCRLESGEVSISRKVVMVR